MKIALNLMILFLISCSNTNSKKIEKYFRCNEDSLYIKSFQFIKDNLSPDELELICTDKELLIRDIELAVNLNRNKIVNGDISFDLFCEYVLPPRIFNESIEDWRTDCYKTFRNLLSLPVDNICDSINYHFKKDFLFGLANNAYSMTWSQLKNIKKGSCYHMAKTVVYPLRSLGIPTSIDIVYNWGTASGGHCWNVVYDEKIKDFMGREEGPATYNPFLIYNNIYYPDKSAFRYPSKIYRKTFSINKEIQDLRKNLSFEDIPIILIDEKVKDVTSEYFKVSDVNLKIKNVARDVEIVYLSVFNYDWTPAVASKINDNETVVFNSVNRGILYLPSIYKNRRVIPVDYPIYLSKDEEVKELIPQRNNLIELTITYCYPLYMEYLYAYAHSKSLPKDIFKGLGEGRYRRTPNKGSLYTLYYWDLKGWKRIDERIASDKNLLFQNVPSNALYKIVDSTETLIGRCFIVENGIIVWM